MKFLAFVLIVVEADAEGLLDLLTGPRIRTVRRAKLEAPSSRWSHFVGDSRNSSKLAGSAACFSENSSWLRWRPLRFCDVEGLLRFTMTETLMMFWASVLPCDGCARLRLAFLLGKEDP